MSCCIALLTDFGTSDWFAASMKGAILCIDPDAAIIDITHEIPAGDIPSAAFCLLSCYSYFPAGTVFVVVVDPGVGSKRPAIALSAGGYFFVAPDNGVLSPTAENHSNIRIRSIENPACMRLPVSTTFHGRDIFAPAAAHISRGFEFDDLGPVQETMVRCALPVAEEHGTMVRGAILYIDRFGNLISNITPALVSCSNARVRVAGTSIPVCSCYADVAEGQLLAVVGSSGFIEISVNQGNAAAQFGIKVGDTVEIGPNMEN
jgi:hypothetical protein